MPQITNGLILGSPGPVPSPSIAILYGSGAPTSLTPNPAQVNVNNCAVGSLYTDYANGNLWYKTLSGWTQVNIP
jgi:hypothetical protein